MYGLKATTKSNYCLVMVWQKDSLDNNRHILLHLALELRAKLQIAFSIIDGAPVFNPNIDKSNLQFTDIGFDITKHVKLIGNLIDGSTDAIDEMFTESDKILFVEKVDTSEFAEYFTEVRQAILHLKDELFSIEIIGVNEEHDLWLADAIETKFIKH